MDTKRVRAAATTVLEVVALAACASQPDQEPAPASTCVMRDGVALALKSGILTAVNLDWANQTLEQYSDSLGRRPAVAVNFVQFPFADADRTNLEAAYEQVKLDGGMLLLTLEPRQGLAAVTEEATDQLAETLNGYNKAGVPVIVRFAHEMNGSWYGWGQQPAEYKAAFRRVAESIHRLAPGSATMWAPNYGGGYPFTGGQHQAPAGSPAARRRRNWTPITTAPSPVRTIPTSRTTRVTMPWTGWACPCTTGEPRIRGAPTWCRSPESSSSSSPGAENDQLVRMNKKEVEVNATVDRRAVGSPNVREAFVAELPEWFKFADDTPHGAPGS